MAGISFFQLVKTSWAIDLLLALSVFAVAVLIDRIWAYRGLRIDEKRLMERVRSAMKRGKSDEAIYMCESANNPLADVIKIGIEYRKLPVEDTAELVDGAMLRIKTILEKRLSILSTISFIAPLLGLLGTVLGIIRAFRDLAVSGSGGPSVVMMGVAEALVTTVLGILIAIPASIGYNFFINHIRTFMVRIEIAAKELLVFIDAIKRKGKEEGEKGKKVDLSDLLEEKLK
ncbi:MotA/TolQ/ExbB proton channel family protein [candidate division WOR-3 bacterium]|nr:MotA/TolQ/ExbB proton channel family protein [candidate division WOR-3 bacterium]MCK4574967.1 MotA/TolQ/ExbB proton channel family protein [candidate division WOR-3 bacterium]